MVTYTYLCDRCGERTDDDRPIGTAIPGIRCPHCAGHARQVLGQVHTQPSLREAAGAIVRSQLAAEARMPADRDAYRRMRKRGLQPPTVAGSARLEDRVGDQLDIKHDRFLTAGRPQDRLKERLVESYAESAVAAAEAARG